VQNSVSAIVWGLQRAKGHLSDSLIWDTVEPDQVKEFQPEFAYIYCLSLHLML
jgi:hypothetical protein